MTYIKQQHHPIAVNYSPISFNMLTTEPSAVGQGTWQVVVQSELYRRAFMNTSHANGDEFDVTIFCPAGTYTMNFNFSRRDSRGIIDVDFDGIEVGSADGYNATYDIYNLIEITGIVLSEGEHVITFRVDGKNASSVGYYTAFNGVSLTRTA